MKRKVFMVGALCLLLMFTLAGCGKHGDTELTVSSDVMDDKVTLSVTDSHSNYTLSKSKDGFQIDGGEEVVNGTFLSVSDAENKQANLYGTDSYSVISIGDSSGFACVSDGTYQHIFQPNGSDFYICLSASKSDANIYAAEEYVSFSVLKSK